MDTTNILMHFLANINTDLLKKIDAKLEEIQTMFPTNNHNSIGNRISLPNLNNTPSDISRIGLNLNNTPSDISRIETVKSEQTSKNKRKFEAIENPQHLPPKKRFICEPPPEHITYKGEVGCNSTPLLIKYKGWFKRCTSESLDKSQESPTINSFQQFDNNLKMKLNTTDVYDGPIPCFDDTVGDPVDTIPQHAPKGYEHQITRFDLVDVDSLKDQSMPHNFIAIKYFVSKSAIDYLIANNIKCLF
jgi:hypothetical protein